MSDHRKTGQDEPLDTSAFDFDDVPGDAPPSDVDFAFETMPEPGSERDGGPPAPRAAAPVTPRFAETDDEDEVDATPKRAPARAAPPARPAQDEGDDFSDFGFEAAEEPRVAPRRVSAQAAPAVEDDGDDDALSFAETPRQAPAQRRGRQDVAEDPEEQEQEIEAGDDVGDGIDEAEEPRRRKSPLSYAPHVGGAVLVAFVGYMAYANLGSILGSSDPAPINIGVPAPKQASVAGVPAPVLPASLGEAPRGGLGLPAPSATGLGVKPAGPSLPPLRDASLDVKPLDVDMIGAPPPAKPFGVTPVGLQAPAPSPTGGAGSDIERRLAELESRKGSSEVADLKATIQALNTRIASLENRVGDAAPRPNVAPPSKPNVIKGWSIRGVVGGVAWVKGPNGPKDFHEVGVGEEIPGVGSVKSVASYENKFVVITSAGVILEQ